MILRVLILISCIMLSVTTLLANQNKNFVYDAKEKRDPFWPLVTSSGTILSYDEDLNYEDLIVEGIVYDSAGNSLAIINGKIFKTGSKITGYLISQIEENRVILIKDNKEFILNLRKGR